MAGRANAFLSGLTGGMTAMNSMLASRDRREALKLQTQLAQEDRDNQKYINNALALNHIRSSFKTPEERKAFDKHELDYLNEKYKPLLQRNVEPGTEKGIAGFEFSQQGRVQPMVGVYELDDKGERTGKVLRRKALTDKGMNDGSDVAVDMGFTDYLAGIGRTPGIVDDAVMARSQILSRGGKLPKAKDVKMENLGNMIGPNNEEIPIIRQGQNLFTFIKNENGIPVKTPLSGGMSGNYQSIEDAWGKDPEEEGDGTKTPAPEETPEPEKTPEEQAATIAKTQAERVKKYGVYGNVPRVLNELFTQRGGGYSEFMPGDTGKSGEKPIGISDIVAKVSGLFSPGESGNGEQSADSDEDILAQARQIEATGDKAALRDYLSQYDEYTQRRLLRKFAANMGMQ